MPLTTRFWSGMVGSSGLRLTALGSLVPLDQQAQGSAYHLAGRRVAARCHLSTHVLDEGFGQSDVERVLSGHVTAMARGTRGVTL